MSRYEPRGKVTFYIPSNTPQEVIDYLNMIKDNGTLSRKLIKIIEEHLASATHEEFPARTEPEPNNESEQMSPSQEKASVLNENPNPLLRKIREQQKNFIKKFS